ncbi:nucleoside phosphorylase [Fulvivirga sediminis]|uniref:Uridine phosphorylase n=1 Tax=Fulvivirga sediminis TaxID=2803949 RepID=A0A937F5A8_9BACT|nr:nucleoside phosphorylase [Fulvivirga sediminis]MBL3656687.1 nucleoside phosphorylase [Fulvivirga sediminis]
MVKIPESELILNKDKSIYHLNLMPNHISDTIITVGDPSRVFMVSKYFDDIDFEMNRREFITHVGTYKGKKITVISTGMGTDNIEIFFTELDALANIDFRKREEKPKKKKLKVIRIGTSGALQDIPLGSHLLSDYAVGLDTLMCFYNLPQDDFENEVGKKLQEQVRLPFQPYVVRGSQELKEQIQGDDMLIGNTVTCPGFYGPQGRKIRLDLKNPKLMETLNYFHHKDMWLTNFEMETAGYYSLGRLLGHDVLSANAIIANRVKNEFAKNPTEIIDSLIKKVLDRL